MRRFVPALFLLGAALASVSSSSAAGPGPQAPASRPAGRAGAPIHAAPKLVVILVVDQMRADYIESYGHTWTAGFRRLMSQGAWFTRAAFPYAATVTCVGHGTIATGSLPSTHGIVGNSWFDRESGQNVACAADPDTRLVRYGTGGPDKAGYSARRLLVPTLPDEMRLQLAHAPKVATFSMKNYTASTLAGQRADVATWFDGETGQWATSTAFSPAPVPWLARFIERHPVDVTLGKAWERLLRPDQYVHEDDGKGEQGLAQWTATFPHPLQSDSSDDQKIVFHEAWAGSALTDDYLARLGMAAVDELKLGQGPGTDYLAISFSALDAVGHDFGPRSHEVQDVLARMDQTLGTLLQHLDRRVPGRYVVAVTSDHGVAPIPEQAAEKGLRAGRLPTATLVQRIEKTLEGLFGPGKYVARIGGHEVVFEPGALARLRANPLAVRALKDEIRQVPGVAAVYFGDELDDLSAEADDRVARAAAAGYLAGRSGDMVVVLKPYWLYGTGKSGTNHGTPYAYDQRVPLFLLGQGIKAGRFDSEAGPVDIAPTLAHLAGVTLAAADGRVLHEALR